MNARMAYGRSEVSMDGRARNAEEPEMVERCRIRLHC